MQRLVSSTPGLSVFLPARAGVAVEAGFSHPVDLRACAVFDEQALILFRGAGAAPLVIERLPVLALLSSFQKGDLLPEQVADTQQGAVAHAPIDVRVRLRVVPDAAALGRITASFVPNAELRLLRRIAYALGAASLARAKIAVTRDGAYLLSDEGVEPLPLGLFYTRVHEAVFVPAGLRVAPAVSPDTIFSALGAPPDHLLFFRPDGSVLGLARGAFIALERALVESERWTPVDAATWQELAATELPTVRLQPLGLRPLADAEPTP
jgi:hypothetical protein